MFDRKIYSGKLCFQFKFCAFILILYLKLNHLNGTPAIDRNKDGVAIVLNPPDIIMTDDSLMSNDKGSTIEYIKTVTPKTESEILIQNKANNYYSYNEGETDDASVEVAILDKDGVENSTDSNKNNDDLVGNYILQFSANGTNSCMLDGLKEYMMSWAHMNGSLVVPNSARSGESTVFFLDISNRGNSTDELLADEVSTHCLRQVSGVIAFSAAFNGLTYAPYKTLLVMKNSLQYLTLKGNNFSSYRSEADSVRNEHGIAWATFPELAALTDLDISNCMIEYISPLAFKNLTNLTSLYLSHNKLLRIPSEAFTNLPKLRYLDLSHLNALDLDFTIPLPSVEQIVSLLVGVKIEQQAFKYLSHLEYLDLSYTKLTRNSAVAFTFVGEQLKYLSLCYTAFPLIGNAIFKNTRLQGLDLSGNSYAAYSIVEDSFSSLSETLLFLFFEQSNLKELDWLKKLQNLLVLNLNSNNINSLSLQTFRSLPHLQVLDLSSNHIGNWYNRIFTYNPKLKILNLRDNNINILTSEMLLDFQELEYLGIGDNNFVCDCVLRDLVDIATANNKKADCVRNVFQNTQSLVQQNISSFVNPVKSVNINEHQLNNAYSGYLATITKYLPMLSSSYQNVRDQMNRLNMYNFRVVTSYYKALSLNSCPNTNQIVIYDKINGSMLKFQLLDYEDEHYWCFNETEKLNFFELNCESRFFHDILPEEIRHITKYVMIAAGILILLSTAVFVIYLKRWHIHYYYSSLKSAALLAVAAQESSEKFNDLSESDSNLIYDLFISYCQSDREWVLEELMPNIEIAEDMSICMHERDFQVGLTILDNIISCMDRSRCLMLVISSNFLLSHWCQFEMRLAQHRMFEASKEHLILVFLEDIPKRKRPKTLQYLMDVKTYIKWPAGNSTQLKPDERKVFWKRLRKSIKNICWDGASRL